MGDERIRARLGALGALTEPIEVVQPATVMGAGGEIVEAAVNEPQPGGRPAETSAPIPAEPLQRLQDLATGDKPT